jgi:hypothetical protein
MCVITPSFKISPTVCFSIGYRWSMLVVHIWSRCVVQSFCKGSGEEMCPRPWFIPRWVVFVGIFLLMSTLFGFGSVEG